MYKEHGVECRNETEMGDRRTGLLALQFLTLQSLYYNCLRLVEADALGTLLVA